VSFGRLSTPTIGDNAGTGERIGGSDIQCNGAPRRAGALQSLDRPLLASF
jgi:hypothetical protein